VAVTKMLILHSLLASDNACTSCFSNRTGTLFRLARASLPTRQVAPANLPSILLVAIRSTMALASPPRILREEARSQTKDLHTPLVEAVRATRVLLIPLETAARATRDLHTPLTSAARAIRALHLYL
jgi:hypothetical protein